MQTRTSQRNLPRLYMFMACADEALADNSQGLRNRRAQMVLASMQESNLHCQETRTSCTSSWMSTAAARAGKRILLSSQLHPLQRQLAGRMAGTLCFLAVQWDRGATDAILDGKLVS